MIDKKLHEHRQLGRAVAIEAASTICTLWQLHGEVERACIQLKMTIKLL